MGPSFGLRVLLFVSIVLFALVSNTVGAEEQRQDQTPHYLNGEHNPSYTHTSEDEDSGEALAAAPEASKYSKAVLYGPAG